MKKGIMLAVVAAAVIVAAPSTALGQDVNCDQFGTHEEAQDFFEAEGGPANDPHGLDADGDGLACEDLPSAAAVVAGGTEELAATGADPWVFALLGVLLVSVGAVAYRRSARSKA